MHLFSKGSNLPNNPWLGRLFDSNKGTTNDHHRQTVVGTTNRTSCMWFLSMSVQMLLISHKTMCLATEFIHDLWMDLRGMNPIRRSPLFGQSCNLRQPWGLKLVTTSRSHSVVFRES